MKTKAKNDPTIPRFSDSILTDNKGMVRLRDLKHNEKIVIKGRTIVASSIPLSNYSLECGHIGQGIAIAVGSVLFCEECKDDKFVVKARS